MVDKLLLEKIPSAGASRVAGISEPWLQQYIKRKYEQVPQQGDLTVECDEMWSFIGTKNIKQWTWLPIDSDSRAIVGCILGAGTVAVPKRCGNPCHQFPVNVLFATRIFGLPINRFYRKRDIGRLVKKKVQSHLKTTRFALGKKNVILFQENRKSHWSHLELYSPL